MSEVVGLTNNSDKPFTNTVWVRTQLCKLQKRWTRLAAASDKVYQLLVHGRWFFPGSPASSTTKTGRHDIAEILLKVELKHQKSINQLRIKQNADCFLYCCTIIYNTTHATVLCQGRTQRLFWRGGGSAMEQYFQW